MSSQLMIVQLRKLGLELMQTGLLRQPLPRLLTKDTSKIHTRRSKLSSHHKCLSKLITVNINQWTSPSLISIISQINKESKTISTQIFLELMHHLQPHLRKRTWASSQAKFLLKAIGLSRMLELKYPKITPTIVTRIKSITSSDQLLTTMITSLHQSDK